MTRFCLKVPEGGCGPRSGPRRCRNRPAGHPSHLSTFQTKPRLISTLLATALLLGCSRGGPTIVPLEGTVTHNGTPVPDLMIYFQPASGRPSWAISDKNGHFAMDYDPDYDGVVTGNHTVWVLENPNLNDPLLNEGKGRRQRSPEMQEVLSKY